MTPPPHCCKMYTAQQKTKRREATFGFPCCITSKPSAKQTSEREARACECEKEHNRKPSGAKRVKIQTGRKREMVSFLNTFLSYLVLMLIIIVVAAAGFAVGSVLRKRKNAGTAATENHKE